MTQLAATGRSAASLGGAARVAQYFWPLAAALLALRLLMAASCNLVPDEAFYWTWTRHLAAGYFDHPPMIAWLLWLSTRLLGNTELAVRVPAVVSLIGSLAVLYVIARQVLPDARAVGFVILMWIAGPLLPVMGTIITPDAPATFFSVCALACAVRIADYDDRRGSSGSSGTGLRPVSDSALSGAVAASRHGLEARATAANWLLFGLFCGLAFLSKYTTVLVPGGVGLAMLFSRRGIAHFRRPWVFLSAIVALAVFSPCIYWNYRHEWASFLFQIHHGGGGGTTEGLHGFLPRFLSIAGFVGGQAALWTPILFVIAVVVMIRAWMSYRRLNQVGRVLLWSGTLPLLFFGLASILAHGQINWPAFAYFPLSILVGRYLSANWQGNRVQWVRKGCEVAVCFTIGVHLLAVPAVQQFLLRCHFPLTHQITDLWGWREFGEKLAQVAGKRPVVCNRHEDAGEAAFYMPGQPDVWCDGVGFRPTAFDYFDSQPDFAHVPEVVFVGGHAKLFMEKWNFTRNLDSAEIVVHGLGKKGQGRVHVVTVVGRSPNDEIRIGSTAPIAGKSQ